MSVGQQDITREVLVAVQDFLGGPTSAGDEWGFEFGEQLRSNWGDVIHGGAVAAGMVAVGRAAVPDRSPRSAHLQIVRSVPSGPAWATATVRHPGRTVATVEVDLFDQRRKLTAIALLTMVTPDAVAAEYDCAVAAPQFRVTETPVEEVELIPTASTPESVMALEMNVRFSEAGVLPRAENFRASVDGSAAGVLECTVPWDCLEFTGPEAACLAADAAVALPVLFSYIPSSAVGPNPDLTLRFTTEPATRVITAASAILSVQHGTTTVGIEVQAGDRQLAHGLATSLLLNRQ
jgi:acyl-coenzyme A thioesterase PaaI-like protein